MHRDSLIGRARQLGFPDVGAMLVVDVASQSMQAMIQGREAVEFPVSTSRVGLGETVNSHRTPRGFHRIIERYGDGAAPGSVFESRVFTGVVLPPDQWRQAEGDRILSRILRLSGCTPGMNADGENDTYSRMIYLHGTNQEQCVGISPSSHGCIRMKNLDIITLFDLVKKRDTWCWVG